MSAPRALRSIDLFETSRPDGSLDPMSAQVLSEAARRRTFAIISHPDAGQDHADREVPALRGCDHVGRRGARRTRVAGPPRRDWMEMEQKRGISITSTALQFPYRDHELNLLDTPGHRDFSEDTYRVLSAVDAVVMVLDSREGHRAPDAQAVRGVPVAQPPGDHVPQQVRPARAWSRSSCSTRSRTQIGLRPTPATWPVGSSATSAA